VTPGYRLRSGFLRFALPHHGREPVPAPPGHPEPALDPLRQ
jgi:hypothetical protein